MAGVEIAAPRIARKHVEKNEEENGHGQCTLVLKHNAEQRQARGHNEKLDDVVPTRENDAAEARRLECKRRGDGQQNEQHAFHSVSWR